jgi:hypothetical protein
LTLSGNASVAGTISTLTYNVSKYGVIYGDSGSVINFITQGGINYIQSGTALTTGSTAPLYFTTIGGTATTMVILGNGNVGINYNSNSPNYKLVIEQGFNNNSNGLFISNTNYGSMQGVSISMVNTGLYNYYSYASIQGYTSGSSASTPLCLQPTSGNVGIGTTNPSTTLHVNGIITVPQINTDASNYVTIYPANFQGYPPSSTNGTGSLSIGWNKTNSNGEITFINNFPGNASNMAGSGFYFYVRTGVSSVVTCATIDRYSTTINGTLLMNGITGSGYWVNSCMRITNGFNSTDGSTQNGTSIQLTNGFNSAYFNIMTYGFSAGSLAGFYIASDNLVGVVLFRGQNSWATYSDERMKINIIPITSTLLDIMRLEPVSYLYESDIDNNCNITCRIGFTAQNVQSIYPHLVTKDASPSYTNKNGEIFNPMTLTMTDLIPYLTKAIQELNTIVQEQHTNITIYKQTLTEENNILKQQLTSQQSQIDALIQRLAAAGIA